MWLAAVAWGALGAAVAWTVRGRLDLEVAWSALGSPGALVPLGVAAALLGGTLLLRARLGRVHLEMEGDHLTVAPSGLRRLLSGIGADRVALAAVRRVWRVALRDGAVLYLEADDDLAPVALPLSHPDVGPVLSRLTETVPDDGLAPRARQALTQFVSDREGLGGAARPSQELISRYARYAGLWELAAPSAWRALAAEPESEERAADLWAVEGVRLPVVARLRLLEGLLKRFPDAPWLLRESARHLLAARRADLASPALDRLHERLPDDPVATFWREAIRTHRALPAPGSKATFGIEVNLPHHELAGDVLVVDDRWKVPLSWFVGVRLLSGFWGPPRGVELVSLRGERRLLQGDPMVWLGRLTGAAPWLVALHDHGLLWPPVGLRLRRIEARAHAT